MAGLTASGKGSPPWMIWAFALTTLTSAGLVFLVQPMVAKLVLPMMGGGPSVWNASMAFFQACLLAGYGYAHLLQKITSLRRQTLIHLLVLAAAGLTLPLQITQQLGTPSSDHPALWLLGVLAITVGAPFAALSATAPLIQSWYGRVRPDETAGEPYALYAASNIGSLLALLAYPLIVEPFTRLQSQTLGWSLGYGFFILLIGGLGFAVSRQALPSMTSIHAQAVVGGSGPGWRDRLMWVLLAAAPSSLMLGVTTYLTTDVASAPFLWVGPLALYLLSFIWAFATKPPLSANRALFLQSIALAACVVLTPMSSTNILLQVAVHLVAFFLIALVCHQALVARRPAVAHLTEFYLWLSVGGVVGGGLNAFVAPVIFNNVYEYPLVLALVCLVRPAGGKVGRWQWIALAVGLILAALAPAMTDFWGEDEDWTEIASNAVLFGAALVAVIIRTKRWIFFALISAITICGQLVGDEINDGQSWRSFFGVITETQTESEALGGTVWILAHGTTMHGGQAENPKFRCRPLIYYSPSGPIGQVYGALDSQPEPLVMGTVGLGAGSVAAFTRPGDTMRFYEIDPLVVDIASDPNHFSYTTTCAKGDIDYVIGDARLTLADEPDGVFDVLLIDAFSSDAIPAHLLTVEAMKLYLRKLAPDGILIVHLSNRHLELRSPAMAVAAAAGGYGLIQSHEEDENSPDLMDAPEDAMIVAKSPDVLAPFAEDDRWEPINPKASAPWTDNYTNLAGALYRRLKESWTE